MNEQWRSRAALTNVHFCGLFRHNILFPVGIFWQVHYLAREFRQLKAHTYISVLARLTDASAGLRTTASADKLFSAEFIQLFGVDHCSIFRATERHDLFVRSFDTRPEIISVKSKPLSVPVHFIGKNDRFFYVGDKVNPILKEISKGKYEIMLAVRRAGVTELFFYATASQPVETDEFLNDTCRAFANMYLHVDDSVRIKGKIADKQNELSDRMIENTDALQQLNERLIQSNTELQQFAYSASHDLQEPLRTITSYINLFIRNYGNSVAPQGLEFLDYASDGARRMHALIKNLLTYSRLDNQEEPMQPIDGNRMLTEAMNNLQLAVEESNALVLYPDMPQLYGNESQLVLLFQNLIDNAIKFRSKAEPIVFIEVDERPDAFEFRVRDNGIGIPPEFHNKIFGFFNRLHARDEYEGTGLGLSICKKIVERHHGNILVDSKPGKGSTFVFSLKKEEAAARR